MSYTKPPYRKCVGVGAIEIRGEPSEEQSNPRVCRILRTDPNCEDNAEFIALACNNYDPLVAALTRIANMLDRDGNEIHMHREELRGIARTALKSVEKSKS